MIGSVRGKDDELIVSDIMKEATRLGIEERVEIKKNLSRE